MRQGLIPGKNVDKLDIAAGLRELAACGYEAPETAMTIEYNLQRWARGEEEQAQNGATDIAFYGVSLTCWYRILGAAMAAATVESSQADQVIAE